MARLVFGIIYKYCLVTLGLGIDMFAAEAALRTLVMKDPRSFCRIFQLDVYVCFALIHRC